MRQLESTFKLLPIFGLLLLFYSGCGTEPKFERVNKMDPSSKDFIPKTGDLSVSLNANKEVLLTWLDISDYEDGYILWKKLGIDGQIERFAEVDKNTTNFIDDSGKIDKTTTYYVAANSKHQQKFDSLDVKNSLLLFDGGISDLEFNLNQNTFSLEWKNTAVVSDFVIIRRIYQDGRTEILDTLGRSVNSYSFANKIDDYWARVKVTSYIFNHNGESQQQSSLTSDRIHYNFPKLVSIDFINEAIAKIEYEDNSDFEDAINVYQRTRTNSTSYNSWEHIGILDEQKNTIQIPSTTHSQYQYKIAAFYNGMLSTTSEIITQSPESRPPTNINIERINGQTIRINWEDANHSVSTYKFILYQRSRSGVLRVIAELEPEVNSFIFNDVPENNIVRFGIRTYSSPFRLFEYDNRN